VRRQGFAVGGWRQRLCRWRFKVGDKKAQSLKLKGIRKEEIEKRRKD
jgi:hypothetical protein